MTICMFRSRMDEKENSYCSVSVPGERIMERNVRAFRELTIVELKWN